jgi:hypothetical protein
VNCDRDMRWTCSANDLDEVNVIAYCDAKSRPKDAHGHPDNNINQSLMLTEK